MLESQTIPCRKTILTPMRESGHPVIADVSDESRERGVLDRPPSRTMTAEKKAGIAPGLWLFVDGRDI
jgi:hypothetical protein